MYEEIVLENQKNIIELKIKRNALKTVEEKYF